MVSEDLQLAQRGALFKEKGFRTFSYDE